MLNLVAHPASTRRPTACAASPISVADNPALWRLAGARRVLLLQGPVGPFFDRLTEWLADRGASVHRVVFQRGDQLDCTTVEPAVFRGSLSEWPQALTRLITSHRIDCIVLFGQARAYHACALAVARELEVDTVVMEEGYLRPGFATMELDGVNGHSTTLDRYRWCGRVSPVGVAWPRHAAGGGPSFRMALHAARHYLALGCLPALNAHYTHHRSTQLADHALHWLRTAWRWALHHHRDARTVARLGRERYYFFPLQNEGDAQITQHSPFASVMESVARVLESFAQHAPPDTLLVLRQHPWSRGDSGSGRTVMELAERLGVAQRVVHLQEGDTARLIQHAAGVVVVNSTVGLMALHVGRPLMVLGEAVYRRADLCHAGDLDRFWRHALPPATRQVAPFLRQLIGLTQVACDLYAPRSVPLDWRINSALPAATRDWS